LANYRLGPEALAFIRTFDVVLAPFFQQIAHLFEAALGDPALRGRRAADFLDGGDCGPDLGVLLAWLGRLDVAFISAERGAVARLRPHATRSHTLLVITHGAAGSTALHADQEYYQPALPVAHPLDSTGCGDAFQATFLCTYLAGASIPAALAQGAAVAARVLQHYGAV
jgi:sugar/nucleoside kinase (ribokinase family)